VKIVDKFIDEKRKNELTTFYFHDKRLIQEMFIFSNKRLFSRFSSTVIVNNIHIALLCFDCGASHPM